MFFSLQTLNSPASTWPSPSKVAATCTRQPLSFGSFTVVLAFGASGFDTLTLFSSPVITTSVAVLALALVTVTAWAGRGPLGFLGRGFAASAGAASAAAGACAATTLAEATASTSPAAATRTRRIGN